MLDMKNTFKFFCFVFVICILNGNAYANTLTLGISNATSGPNKDLGIELNKGAQAYFDLYNKSSNAQKRIKIVALDDGYEPELTYKNTVLLAEQFGADILFNYVGTPTSKAILPLLHKYNIPYFSPFTGANFLRSRNNNYIVNLRASYYQEAEHQVRYFVDRLKLRSVALFIQADDYGLEASKGFNASLKKRDITHFPELRYKRNTNNIDSAIELIQTHQPDVIFTVGTHQPLSKLIKYIDDQKLNIKIVALSFTNSTELIEHIPLSTEFYFTTVVPNPWTSASKIAKQYRNLMPDKIYSFNSFEGYINAWVLTQILEKVTGKYEPQKFINAIKEFSSNDPQFPLTFINNQASRATYLHHFNNGKITELNHITHNYIFTF